MFLFKKIVGPFLQPIPFCLSLLLLGLIFLWFTRRQKTGKVLVCAGTLVLAIFSYGGVSDLFIRPLEQQYPPITDFQAIKDVKWIVVLGGGSTVDPALPLSSYLSTDFTSNLFSVIPAYRFHVKPKIGKALACQLPNETARKQSAFS